MPRTLSELLTNLFFQTIHADTIDLSDKSLQVDISDALSEKDKVKFTVHTKTTLPEFQKPDNLVVRQHEEFVWLHDRFEENEEYAGYIVCGNFTFMALPQCTFESCTLITLQTYRYCYIRFHRVHQGQISMRRARSYKNSARVREI